MRTNLKYTAFPLILYTAFLSLSLVGIIVLLTDDSETPLRYLALTFYGMICLCSFILLLVSVKNLQWYQIADSSITVYCPFGIIRQIRLDKIQKAFRTNATVFQLKALTVRRPHIVLCLKKSLKTDVDDAYNGKRKPYIIIPHSTEAEYLLRTEYKKLCGQELIIN